MSEYGGEPDFWVWRYPLVRAFPLYAAGQERAGVKPGGPTYAEMEMLKALRAAAPKPKPKKQR